jgi:hypothetical protein
MDNDGWPDFCVANDLGKRNLQRNNGNWTSTDIAKEAGVAKRAIQEFQKAINLKGDLALAHSRHAQPYKRIGDEDRAEQELSVALLEMADEAEELVGAPLDSVLRSSLGKSSNRFARDHILSTAVCIYGS